MTTSITVEDLYDQDKIRNRNLGKYIVRHHYDVIKDLGNSKFDNDEEENLL